MTPLNSVPEFKGGMQMQEPIAGLLVSVMFLYLLVNSFMDEVGTRDAEGITKDNKLSICF